MVLAQFFHSTNFVSIFLLIWVLGWVIGGIVAMATLMWLLAGRETLILSDKTLTITRSIPVWSRQAEYTLKQIQDIRLRQRRRRRNKSLGIFNRAEGEIIFTYDGRTVGFGMELNQTEAKALIKRIMARYLTSTSRP